MSNHQVIVDPKTGRMRTESPAPTVTAEDVARTRRELRDRLSGNTPFHVDEFAIPKPVVPAPAQSSIYDDPDYFYGIIA